MRKFLNDYLSEIQNKSEKTKLRIIWFLVVFCVIVMIGVWIVIFQVNKKNVNRNSNFQFPPVPNFQEEFNNINMVVDEFKTLTDGLYSEEEKMKIVKIVEKYIQKNNLLTEKEIENLKFQSIEKKEDGWIVKYVQYHNDIAVNEGENIFVVDTEKGEVIKFSLNFDSDINIDSEPSITEEEAFNIVSGELDDESLMLQNIQLVIYKEQKNNSTDYYLVWKIDVFSAFFEKNYYYFINAHNGNIISFHS
ncbi:MAG: PepSY domain-containing protein [Patescibacteria group bacterium]|nr:PepSY domain-containing protein [Patescibacteria group bacterium]